MHSPKWPRYNVKFNDTGDPPMSSSDVILNKNISAKDLFDESGIQHALEIAHAGYNQAKKYKAMKLVLWYNAVIFVLEQELARRGGGGKF